MDGQAAIDLERPRSIPELIGASFDLYLRVPILFLVLAAVVVVPWDAIILLITGNGPLALGHASLITNTLVTMAGYFFATPLISALHVHAVRELGEGKRPRLFSTFRQSLPALPVVILATGISGTAITLGFLALAIPGFFLTLMWAVVAQTAAVEGGGWIDALRSSADLTKGHRWHVLWLFVAVGAITFAPWLGLRAALGHTTTTVGSFAAGTVLQVVMRSVEALVLAVLYFDLKARRSIPPEEPAEAPQVEDGRAPGWYIDPSQPTRMRYWAADGSGWSKRTTKTPGAMLYEWREQHATAPAPPAMNTDEHTGHSLDPDVYTDEGRPPGWYVDPNQPSIMRYWHAGEQRCWSQATAKTPKQAQAEWRDVRWRS